MTDAERFDEWLHGTSKAKPAMTSRKPRRKATVLILNDELAKPIGVVNGLTTGGKGNSKRTGYVGQRQSAPEVTGECTVTFAEGHPRHGDTYILRTTRNRASRGSRKLTTQDIDRINKLQAKRVTVTDFNMDAIGNIE